jgi:hypothetical protein
MTPTDVDHGSEEWAQARARVTVRRDFATHVVTYLVVNAALVLIWALTGAGYFWPAWVLGLWGVGLVLHGWEAFVRRPVTDEDVEAELERHRQRTMPANAGCRRALVVFESMFGNTEAVARAVADGIAPQLPVEVLPVDQAPPALPEEPVLVVVGGPTHAFGMSRRRTREDAGRRGARAVTGTATGLRDWLALLPEAAEGSRGAAFDTRVHLPLPGSAATKAERRLRRVGVRVVTPAATFWVGGTPGPLLEGELARAAQWGAQVAAAALGATSSR